MSNPLNIADVTISNKRHFTIERLNKYLHSSLSLGSVLLILSSPWLFMARRLMTNSHWINSIHVYLGLVITFFSILFLFCHCINGYWRQFFPWVKGDIKPLISDLAGLFKGQLPIAGGKGLFSCIEGLGMLTLVATGLTGSMWFFNQGTADAMLWREIHQHFALGLMVYLGIHILCALSHVLAMLKS